MPKLKTAAYCRVSSDSIKKRLPTEKRACNKQKIRNIKIITALILSLIYNV